MKQNLLFSALLMLVSYNLHGADGVVRVEGVGTRAGKSAKAARRAAKFAQGQADIDVTTVRAQAVRLGATANAPVVKQGVVFAGKGVDAAAAAAPVKGDASGGMPATQPAASSHDGQAAALVAGFGDPAVASDPIDPKSLVDVPDDGDASVAGDQGDPAFSWDTDEDAQQTFVPVGVAAAGGAFGIRRFTEGTLTSDQVIAMRNLQTLLATQSLIIDRIFSGLVKADQLKKILDTMIGRKAITDEDVVAVARMFQAVSTTEVTTKLKERIFDPSLQQAAENFFNKLMPVIRVILPRDAALQDELARSLPLTVDQLRDTQEQLRKQALSLEAGTKSATSRSRIASSVRPKFDSNKKLMMLFGLLAGNVAIMMFMIFGNSTMQQVGTGILIAEGVMLAGLALKSHHGGLPMLDGMSGSTTTNPTEAPFIPAAQAA